MKWIRKVECLVCYMDTVWASTRYCHGDELTVDAICIMCGDERTLVFYIDVFWPFSWVRDVTKMWGYLSGHSKTTQLSKDQMAFLREVEHDS